MATEDSVTGLALEKASSTTNYNKQNVHYKMKYNATTKQWEQEEIMTPLVPIERIDHLSGIAEIWVLSNMGVLASFIGFNQLAKRGVKDDNKS